MDRLLLPGEPELEVNLRRSARAKKLSLRVSRLDGRVTLTMPKRAREREAIAFAQEKADWIRGHLVARPEAVVPAIGGWVWFRGEKYSIVQGTGRAAKIIDGVVTVSNNDQKAPTRIASFLKFAARADLTDASEGFARDLGVSFGRISLRDTRSRWGSCSHEGNLMYSWRLVMAPPYVLRYVAAHEVAHLIEMNHSADFWAVVERIFPDHKEARKWLRDHGEELHRFRFTN